MKDIAGGGVGRQGEGRHRHHAHRHPAVAGPGAIATVDHVVVPRGGRRGEKLALYASIALTTGITLVALLFATALVRILGRTGINVISRIMGLILAATAAQFIIDGWREAMAG